MHHTKKSSLYYNFVFISTFVLSIWMTSTIDAYGQDNKKTISALRINNDIKLDGFLNEGIWENAEIASGFIQSVPVFGVSPSQKTEVKVLYDNKGIHIGAMLYDEQPSKILRELSKRDERNNTDWFGVSFDTYQDGINGFAFIVTAAGVQQDLKFTGNNEDESWDAVWESELQYLENGWSVEMFIPYYAVRFANVDIQHWNVQFTREIRRNREEVNWNPVDPSIRGFINQAGHLEGINDIKSPVRLSLTPFITGYINTFTSPNNPSENNVSPAYTGGMDLKYGINDAFTLDMTLIPDFGQVLSDNQVLNLSAFEVYFEENRQFFTEGIELFDKGRLFYTRRVGGRPFGYWQAYDSLQDDEAVINNPDISQLYNATKISGRLSSGTGLGIFNAVAGPEYATIENTNTGAQRQVQTNSLTNYNVIVADQNLKNNSVVSIINTNVHRKGEDRDANVTGMFFRLNTEGQKYGVWGKAVVSNKYSPNDIETGHSYSLGFGKISGNWKYEYEYVVESDDFDPNDLGILFSPNERSMEAKVRYVKYKPKNKNLQRWEVSLSPQYERLYNPNVYTDFSISARSFIIYKSRNALGFHFTLDPVENFDYFDPRTSDFSRYYTRPTHWRAGGFFSSDYRKTFALDLRGSYTKFNEPGFQRYFVLLSPRARISDKLSFIIEADFSKSSNEAGFVNKSNTDQEIIGDNDILYGRRNRQVLENSIRAQYIFNNKMSLSARVRHYWAQVEYASFHRLTQDGYLDQLAYDGKQDGESLFDRNINFFNIDLNYTWRFAKGSDLIFVWKHSLIDENKDLESNYFGNVKGLIDNNRLNSFSLKMIYFLDYGTLFKSST